MSRQALGLHLEVALILPEAQLEKEAGEHKGGCFFLCTHVFQDGKSFARLGAAGEGSREGPSRRCLRTGRSGLVQGPRTTACFRPRVPGRCLSHSFWEPLPAADLGPSVTSHT